MNDEKFNGKQSYFRDRLERLRPIEISHAYSVKPNIFRTEIKTPHKVESTNADMVQLAKISKRETTQSPQNSLITQGLENTN